MPKFRLATGLLLLACASLPVAVATPGAIAQETEAAAGESETTTEATATRSINDGVYTEEQAARGDAVYDANCKTCHSVSLRGTPGGPSLIGNKFRNRWVDGTVAEIYTFVHDFMPAGRGGSLSEQEYIDVVAYILSKQKYPAGEEELPADVEVLSQITVEREP